MWAALNIGTKQMKGTLFSIFNFPRELLVIGEAKSSVTKETFEPKGLPLTAKIYYHHSMEINKVLVFINLRSILYAAYLLQLEFALH